MDRNSSERTALDRLGTWRSGGESPSFPGSGDARRLLRAVDRTPVGAGCTLVRVRLGGSDRRTLVRVREHLLGEKPIVGTSIGRDAGPDDPGTFDILVVPGCDPVTVGHAIAAVDDVVGVAATAFETPDAGGRHAVGASDPADAVVTGEPVVDEAFAELRAAVKGGADEQVVDEQDQSPLAGDDEGVLPGGVRTVYGGSDPAEGGGGDLVSGGGAGSVTDDGAGSATEDRNDTASGQWSSADGVEGLEALRDADGGRAASAPSRDGNGPPPDPACPDEDGGLSSNGMPRMNGGPGRDGGRRTNGGRPTNGGRRTNGGRNRRSNTNGDHQTSETGDRQASGDGALPHGDHGNRSSSPDRSGRDDPGGNVQVVGADELGDRLERLDGRLSSLEAAVDGAVRGAAPEDRSDSTDGHPTPDELADRLASLESTVAELERCQRRLRDALVGDPH